MQVQFCKSRVELGRPYLRSGLRDCSDLLDDHSALCDRFAQDGYLLVRGMLDRRTVLAARRGVLTFMAQRGCDDDKADLMVGRIHEKPGGILVIGRTAWTNTWLTHVPGSGPCGPDGGAMLSHLASESA